MEQSLIQEVNQQERQQLAVELSWAAGIIEGEGYVGLAMHKRGYTQLIPKVQVINTDERLLDEYGRILKASGLAFYRKRRNCDTRETKYMDGKPFKRKKPITDISITGFKRVSRICDAVLPYMRGKKKDMMKIVNDFCKYRLTQSFTPYTDKDYQFYRDYRKVVESPETLRLPSGVY